MRRQMVSLRVWATAAGVALAAGSALTGASARPADPRREAPDGARAVEALAALPMRFEPNVGQAPSEVRYVARGTGYALFLTDSEAVLSLARDDADRPDKPGLLDAEPEAAAPQRALRLRWSGARAGARAAGVDELPSRSNYFVGADPAKWRAGVANFARVRYEGVYEGVDAVFYGDQGRLEYDFVVAPGADPDQIRVRFEGADGVSLDENGDLVLRVGGGEVRQYRSSVYQHAAGGRRPVAARYVLGADGEVAIDVGAYDPALPLVVDPVLEYATYLGGTAAYDDAEFVAVDASGAAYVTGVTRATNFPATPGAFDTSHDGGGFDAYVAKIAPGGGSLVYATYLGGDGFDAGTGIAVDASGAAYVSGGTSSGLAVAFPTTPGAYDTSYNGGNDVFVAKVHPNGASLVYSTFLGGDTNDSTNDIAIDAAGAVYVAGMTSDGPGADFPTTAGAFDTTFNGGSDAFVAKLAVDGSALAYSTLVGGATNDFGRSIGVDASGAAYVAGQTSGPMSTFPTTPGAFDPSYNGGNNDVFVTKLAVDGSALTYSTFLGSPGGELTWAMAVDGAGSAYVMSGTFSSMFPTTPGAYDTTHNGDSDLVVTKLAPDGASLVYSTYLGGSNYEEGYGGLAVDGAGAAYVTGATYSTDYPTTPGAYDTSLEGGGDAFVTKLAPNGASLAYSTFLGGTSGYENGYGIAADASGAAYVVGVTGAVDFPTVGALPSSTPDRTNNAFVTKLAPAGNALVYSTHLGGNVGGSQAFSQAVAVDASGAAFVVGQTDALDYPTTLPSHDVTPNGDVDVVVTKLSADGASLVYSTYLGSASQDLASDVAVDASGAAYVTGRTAADSAFPTTPGALSTVLNGTFEAFVTKLSANGSTLLYSTYLGGGGNEFGRSIAVDASGAAHVVGSTTGAFPVTAGAYDESFNGAGDGFVAKLNATGSALVFATYVGGDAADEPRDVALDASGAVYVTGFTSAHVAVPFPTTAGAFDTTFNGGVRDGFALKLSAAGSALAYSTYLGGDASEFLFSIAVDGAGAAYVAGISGDGTVDYPTTPGAFDTTHDPTEDDVVVTKLAASGASLVYSTFLGGTLNEAVGKIAVDATGIAYVSGSSDSPDYPTTAGAFDTTHNGGNGDVTLTKLAASGASLVYSTFLGGSGDDEGFGLALGSGGAAYISGITTSTDFATTGFGTRDRYNIFVLKLETSLLDLALSKTHTGSFTVGGTGTYTLTVSNAGSASAGSITVTDTLPAGLSFSSGSGPGWAVSAVGQTVTATNAGPLAPGASAAFTLTVNVSCAAAPGVTNTATVATPGDANAANNTASDPTAVVDATAPSLTCPAPATAPAGAGCQAAVPNVLAGVTASDNCTPAGSIALAQSPAAGTLVGLGATQITVTATDAAGNTSMCTTSVTVSDTTPPAITCPAPAVAMAPANACAARVDLSFSVSDNCGGAIAVTTTPASGSDFPVGTTTVTITATDVAGNTSQCQTTVTVVDATAPQMACPPNVQTPALTPAGRVVTYATPSASDACAGAMVSCAPAPGSTFAVGVTTVTCTATDASNNQSQCAFTVEVLPLGLDTVGIYIPSTGAWFLRNANGPGGADLVFSYGPAGLGWIALRGDWNGDGADTPGLYDPQTGFFFLKNSQGPGGADLVFSFGPGGLGFVPMVGDWDGDGVETIGIYDPASGAFFLRNQNAPGGADLVFTFGAGGQGFVPLAGDWDGDGDDTIGLYVPSNGFFFLRNQNSPGGADLVFSFGAGGAGIDPVVGDYDGDGDDTVGIYIQSSGTWFLRQSNTPGGADLAFGYGPANARPLVGDWNGQ
jgi:uncharacterized repeat protein (TIGR01451 family)